MSYGMDGCVISLGLAGMHVMNEAPPLILS